MKMEKEEEVKVEKEEEGRGVVGRGGEEEV